MKALTTCSSESELALRGIPYLATQNDHNKHNYGKNVQGNEIVHSQEEANYSVSKELSNIQSLPCIRLLKRRKDTIRENGLVAK